MCVSNSFSKINYQRVINKVLKFIAQVAKSNQNVSKSVRLKGNREQFRRWFLQVQLSRVSTYPFNIEHFAHIIQHVGRDAFDSTRHLGNSVHKIVRHRLNHGTHITHRIFQWVHKSVHLKSKLSTWHYYSPQMKTVNFLKLNIQQ